MGWLMWTRMNHGYRSIVGQVDNHDSELDEDVAVVSARTLAGRMRLIAGYLRGQVAGVPGPSGISIETTVRCNLRCPMCPRTLGNYPHEDMPDNILYPLLDEHARLGGDYVYLYGLGEPFLDTRIFDVLARCRGLGLGTILSTNGSFLDEERRDLLLKNPCDHLIVSIDAATRPTFEHYRVGGDFERVVSQVQALAREKVSRRAKMVLTLQMVLMEKNRAEVEDFFGFWRKVRGVDLVRLKDEEFGVPEVATYGQDGHLRRSACRILWRGPMLVRYTGDVYSCYPMAMYGKPLGNLREHSLASLWNGEENRHLRELHVAGRSGENAACKQCPCTRPHLPFVVGAMALRGTTAQRLIPIAERLGQLGTIPFAEKRQGREG